jgi:hypothetical protein
MKKITYTVLGLAILMPAITYACFSEWGLNGGYEMMGYGGGMGSFGLFAVMAWSVWIVVGILACVWLWQNINKK